MTYYAQTFSSSDFVVLHEHDKSGLVNGKPRIHMIASCQRLGLKGANPFPMEFFIRSARTNIDAFFVFLRYDPQTRRHGYVLSTSNNGHVPDAYTLSRALRVWLEP